MTTTRSRILTALVAVALLAGACSSEEEPFLAEDTSTTPSITEAPTTTTQPEWMSMVATPTAPGPVAIHASPDGPVDETAQLTNPRLINNDPNAAVPLAMLVKQKVGDWYEVYLPLRPNGRTGWVPADSVTTTNHPYQLRVNLGEKKIRLFQEGEETWSTDVAVAKNNTPTPGGLYYTTELLAPPNPGGPYGPYAYGLSGFSDVLETFNGGPGQLGIHGTNQPDLIGTEVSNGCVRMRNEDIVHLAEVVGLPLGVPVEIVA